MTMTEYTSKVTMFSRIAGEMNAKGEINIEGGLGNYVTFADFVDDCVRKYESLTEDTPFDLYANECLSKEYPADYYKECRHLSDWVFDKFFYGAPTENDHDGLRDTPASAYQFVVSSLEMLLWETHGADRDILKQAVGVCEYLRDQQKLREWSRR